MDMLLITFKNELRTKEENRFIAAINTPAIKYPHKKSFELPDIIKDATTMTMDTNFPIIKVLSA